MKKTDHKIFARCKDLEFINFILERVGTLKKEHWINVQYNRCNNIKLSVSNELVEEKDCESLKAIDVQKKSCDIGVSQTTIH